MSGLLHSRAAPSYAVPSHQIISVEHPCIVNDVSKALQTLGGSSNVSKVGYFTYISAESVPYLVQLVEKDDVSATLYLRREDPMSRPIESRNVFTQNVVLRVIVPKRTGRRRKRGSQDPYQKVDEATTGRSYTSRLSESTRKSRDAQTLLRTLRDTQNKYEIQPVGVIEQTHRFRSKRALHEDFLGNHRTKPLQISLTSYSPQPIIHLSSE